MDARITRSFLALLLLVASAGAASGAGTRGRSPKLPPSGVKSAVRVPEVPPILSGLIAVDPGAEIKLPEAPAAERLPAPAALPALPGIAAGAPAANAAPPSASAKDELGSLSDGLVKDGAAAADKAYDGKPADAAVSAPDGFARPRRPVRASLNFYNRQQPSSRNSDIRKYKPTADEVARARAALLEIGEKGGEIFNAPTWLEKAYFPQLKAAVFGVAFLDEALTDFANAQEADIPADIPEGADVLGAILERRAALMVRYEAEVERIALLPRTKVQSLAWKQLEAWYAQGRLSSYLDNPDAANPWPFRKAALIVRKLRKIALGRDKAAKPKQVRALAVEFAAALREGIGRHEARHADAALAVLLGQPRVMPAEAKRIYDGAIGEAKNANLAANQAHLAARAQAQMLGTLFAAPNLGKQIRPTCTVHMLQSLLASMGVHRNLKTLVREARVILGDPFVGMATPFNLEMQQKLFQHYGRVSLLKEGFFEAIVKNGRALKVGIEIGDPVYKHSLILEGFYRLEGRTYAALRDSTSYFPIRFTLEDFAKILTRDPAVLFLEVYDRPHGLPK